MISKEALVLKDVSKRYGRGEPIISGLSRTFRPGAATGLIGPNGSGKTTLLRLISVISYPTAGSVHYGNLDIHAHPYRYLQHVGLVHETADLPQHLSAVELLEYVLRARDRWDGESPRRIREILDHLMLDERRENLIGAYSSGMLRKTQIALALVVDPSVLLMDEPFRGLDEATTKAALTRLQAYKASGGIIIVSSHLKDTLKPLCDEYIRFPLPHSAGS